MFLLTKVRSKAPGDEVVGPSPPHLPVGADGRHGEGGDGRDHSWEENDDRGQPDASLPDHPAETNEEHHTPDV